MSRLVTWVVLGASSLAYAEEPKEDPAPSAEPPVMTIAPPDLSDQAIGASIGAATGGRTTPGGLRVVGHYLYQLTHQDWFDGTAAFTFGSGGAACFRDRMDTFLCDHGLADGNAVEIGANVRRFLGGRDEFWPFLRLGVSVALVRFGDDDVTGFAIPLHAGGGLRVSVTPDIAITAQGELALGIARFNNSLGSEPQIGATITAGAEFGL